MVVVFMVVVVVVVVRTYIMEGTDGTSSPSLSDVVDVDVPSDVVDDDDASTSNRRRSVGVICSTC